jgi:hypothetical protein
MLQARDRRQKPHDFVGAQDYRQLPMLARVGNALNHGGASEGDAVEEEAQGANRNVKSGPGGAARRQVDLIGPDLRQPQPIRRPVEVGPACPQSCGGAAA